LIFAAAARGVDSASAVISAAVDGRPSNFCSSGASGVSVPPSRLEMNSTVLCRLTICSCAARRRATVAKSTSSASSSACGLRAFGQIRTFESGKETGQTRAFRRVRARRTGQESALVAVRDATLESAVVLEESRAARRRDQPGRAKSSLGHAEGRFTAKKRRPERRTTRGDARGDEPRIAPIGGGRRYRAAIDARTHLSL
jgi:hypothetical protein